MQVSDLYSFKSHAARLRGGKLRLRSPGKGGLKDGLPVLFSGPVAMAVVLAIAAILIRLPDFGNPTYHIDEAFYLFVGQRMHAGLLPYIDLWDRKPAGLFVLYAIIAQFGSVYAYQAFAAASAWGTALTIAHMATRFAGRPAACAAGTLYLATIGALAGGGGQSPIFYNLLIALAALLVMRQARGEPASSRTMDGPKAMLLCGLALTIKPTAVVEGVFFGLALLAIKWRAEPDGRRFAIYAAGLAASALAPTALIWALFYAGGHLGDYWFATMQSIFLTTPPTAEASGHRLAWLATIMWMPAVTAAGGLVTLARTVDRPTERRRVDAVFVTGWLVAAVGGFLLIPNYYDHYALPLASVLALASASLFDRRGTGLALAALATGYALFVSGFPVRQLERTAASQAGFATATAIITQHAEKGCMFVYDATPALYGPFAACSANKYAFPEHLSNQREANAIGGEPMVALQAVLSQDPGVIVVPVTPSVSTPNRATRKALRENLRWHYIKVGEAMLVDVVGRQQIEIWARAR